MDLVAPYGRPYSIPNKDQDGVVLATQDGNDSRLWHVHISAPTDNWGDNQLRLEGYTEYNNEIWKVIAWYRLGSTDGILGEMELISTTPE